MFLRDGEESPDSVGQAARQGAAHSFTVRVQQGEKERSLDSATEIRPPKAPRGPGKGERVG